jgi:hypothetical protein
MTIDCTSSGLCYHVPHMQRIQAHASLETSLMRHYDRNMQQSQVHRMLYVRLVPFCQYQTNTCCHIIAAECAFGEGTYHVVG